ncbi:mitotic-spindle organizing protein 1 isoform X1 [Microtus oregoni]|uniref:mitotic-spindle organizing protein 1 isoform X1 n=1 Tax=Microtus oregoni TaxID=111838 RepID=UPI001BB17E9D|nr:mitotic-spindle organizing protein 1 isoform X1 [Microtus oregoni]
MASGSGAGAAASANLNAVRETMDVLLEISRILNTGLDMETLSICVRLCEQGINPEALSSVIKELRKGSEALKILAYNMCMLTAVWGTLCFRKETKENERGQKCWQGTGCRKYKLTSGEVLNRYVKLCKTI